MSSFDEVFAAVKEYCKERLVLATYNLFIDGIEPVSFEGSVATLSVRSDFVKGIVETRYKDLLREAFKELLGFDIDVELTIPAPVEQAPAEVPGGGNYEFTFENFIVGSTNKFAHAAAQAVAANPSGAYNPLFIWGGSGLGKTHLLGAIQFEIHKNFPDYNIVYVDGEKFTNEIISAIHDNTTAEFHNKYRAADVLLVDDIQFLAGKESTQEEFFHTFDFLHSNNKQIILTSDRPPKEIATLSDRLRNRFEMGLMADIQPPDLETRIAIIRRKAESLDIPISDDIAEYIAGQLKSNVRQLEGVVKNMKAQYMLKGEKLSVLTAQNAIRDIRNDNQPVTVTVDRIISEVARSMMVKPEDIRSQKRSAPISQARQVAEYVMRNVTGLPMQSIGDEFGARDHSTIVYAIRKVEERMEKDSVFKNTVNDIIKNISEG